MNNIIIELALVIASMQRTIEEQNMKLMGLQNYKNSKEIPF